MICIKKAYTIGVAFPSTPHKTYEFATTTDYTGCKKAVVVDAYNNEVEVSLIYIVRQGITKKATKWRLGTLVTQKQREQFGIKEEKVMDNKLCFDKVQDALDTIRRLQRDISKKGGDSFVDTQPQLSVSKSGEFIVSGVSSNILSQKTTLRHEVRALVDYIYEDDAKTQARDRLAALEKEAAEIRKLLS